MAKKKDYENIGLYGDAEKGGQAPGSSRFGYTAYDNGASGTDGTGNRVVYPSTVGSRDVTWTTGTDPNAGKGKNVKPGLPPLTPEDNGGGNGDNGSGSGSGSTAGAAAAAQTKLGRSDVTVDPYGPFQGTGLYDPEADAAYQAAMQTLREAQAKMPGYNPSYGDDIQSLYQQITGRGPFSYDLDADMLYQQYRDQYMRQGQQAMQDTIGQAAALTGGYGSSYAQNVGQQAYNSYVQQLNERIPELEERAYQRWLGEGDQLQQQYAMLRDLQDQEYGQYRDAMSDWRQDLSYADQQAQLAYNRGLNANETAWDRAVQDYQLGLQANENAYSRQQDEQARLLQLMQIGYTPTEEDLRAAGMTTDMGNAWAAYIAAQNAPKGGGGGGTTNEDAGTLVATPEEWRDYLHEQIAKGEISADDYGLYMGAMFPEYRLQQVAEQNPTLTEEEKKKLSNFSIWSQAGGGL